MLTQAWTEHENSTGEFPGYARLLSERGTPAAESRYSWTVDLAARRKQAPADMQPHVEEEARLKTEVVSLRGKLRALKAANPKDKKIDELQMKIVEQEKAARDSEEKAPAIDATVFDLKAVNPNAIVKIDTRTPDEVIASIANQGKIVANALTKVRKPLQAEGA